MYINVVGLVTGPDLTKAFHKDHYLCDILEVRLDTFENSDWLTLIQMLNENMIDSPLLLTCRLQRDGGKWPNSETKNRLASIKKLIAEIKEAELIVDCLDWELEESHDLGELTDLLKQNRIELLLSHHNFNSSYTQAELESLHHQMIEKGANSTKFALMYQNAKDIMEAHNFVKSNPKNLKACFGMGELGKQSRLLHPLIGRGVANWTYGYVGEHPSAPGQIHVKEMHDFFASLH